jgi:hypothetical protein
MRYGVLDTSVTTFGQLMLPSLQQNRSMNSSAIRFMAFARWV